MLHVSQVGSARAPAALARHLLCRVLLHACSPCRAPAPEPVHARTLAACWRSHSTCSIAPAPNSGLLLLAFLLTSILLLLALASALASAPAAATDALALAPAHTPRAGQVSEHSASAPTASAPAPLLFLVVCPSFSVVVAALSLLPCPPAASSCWLPLRLSCGCPGSAPLP
jgi:hypothetical protein